MQLWTYFKKLYFLNFSITMFVIQNILESLSHLISWRFRIKKLHYQCLEQPVKVVIILEHHLRTFLFSFISSPSTFFQPCSWGKFIWCISLYLKNNMSTKNFPVCLLAISQLLLRIQVLSVLKSVRSEDVKTVLTSDIWPSRSWDNWG